QPRLSTHLISFPTRRSSDLPGYWSGQASSTVEIGIDVKAMRNGKVVLNTAVFAERTRDGDAGPYCSGGAEVIAEAIASATREVIDRKSTRLNSSHVSISYAV